MIYYSSIPAFCSPASLLTCLLIYFSPIHPLSPSSQCLFYRLPVFAEMIRCIAQYGLDH